QRIGPQQLEGAEASLLGEEPHRDQRHQDEEQLTRVVELVLPQAEHEVHAAEAHVEVEVGVEEPAGEDQEDAGQRVEQERREVEHELLAGDREQAHETRSWWRTSSRKLSSRRVVPSRSPSSAGVPSATMRPLAITTTRSHRVSTSERMWLENSTVR